MWQRLPKSYPLCSLRSSILPTLAIEVFPNSNLNMAYIRISCLNMHALYFTYIYIAYIRYNIAMFHLYILLEILDSLYMHWIFWNLIAHAWVLLVLSQSWFPTKMLQENGSPESLLMSNAWPVPAMYSMSTANPGVCPALMAEKISPWPAKNSRYWISCAATFGNQKRVRLGHMITDWGMCMCVCVHVYRLWRTGIPACMVIALSCATIRSIYIKDNFWLWV